MLKKLFLSASLFTSLVFAANAAIITVEYADATFPNANNDLAAYWATINSSDISSDDIAVATGLYKGSSNNNTIFNMSIEVNTAVNTVFDLYAGLDAGRGAEVFLNGSLVVDVNDNLWWSNNWNPVTNSAELISATGMNLSTGYNIINVLWAENGNSGGNSFELAIDGGQRQALSSTQLSTVSVPAPSSIALLGLALVGVAFTRRTK
ncbi:CCXG family PEP-CTERM protein [Glaciecola petra]|uniref:CCXG family PEP-CTERM protein n=1 Tax=Glaciecola petra TaxID=3075602 RepID=A0ABU2ZS38_9ALTE|nr:CCXG family PEP-CTERM protein [Aestuariibacter sp. P117]MDT0595441.1 CCXG family PEP-CTERM protein [Aestuariibacter sp. P117]